MESNFICDVCGKSFKRKSHLTRHVRSHGALEHMCKSCPKTFRTNAYLSEHVKTHETKNTSYKCKLCEATFLTKGGVKKHEKTKHEEKTHICKYCNSKFARNYVKNSHELKCSKNLVKPKTIPKHRINQWYEIKIMYLTLVHF